MPMMPANPLQAGPDRQQAVRDMFDRIAPRYGRMNSLMTFGLDRRWRRRAVAALALPPGALVVDVGCGPGELCRELERQGYRAAGFDLSEGMLRAGGRGRSLVLADGLRLPLADGSVDGVTCGFALRNVADPALLLVELGRVLTGGGRLSLLEVAEPARAPVRAVHRAYFHGVVPWVGGLLSDRQAYRYLPQSAVLLPSAAGLSRMTEAAGFTAFRRQLLGFGAAQLVTATKGRAHRPPGLGGPPTSCAERAGRSVLTERLSRPSWAGAARGRRRDRRRR
jgi:demethylmenaquinone methyltransferase/2-methoxy-6-polyprenyl-1,4-benzoquinol methylase